MKIKQPNSDNALESLWRQIDLARGRLANCATSNHDVTAVLYISSLIITPNVVFNGARLLDEISNLTNLSPSAYAPSEQQPPNILRARLI